MNDEVAAAAAAVASKQHFLGVHFLHDSIVRFFPTASPAASAPSIRLERRSFCRLVLLLRKKVRVTSVLELPEVGERRVCQAWWILFLY